MLIILRFPAKDENSLIIGTDEKVISLSRSTLHHTGESALDLLGAETTLTLRHFGVRAALPGTRYLPADDWQCQIKEYPYCGA